MTARKSAIIYVSTSAVWEDKFIDILMIILHHSASLSSTAVPHTLVSRRAGAAHLAARRNDKSVAAELLEAARGGAGAAKRAQPTRAGRVRATKLPVIRPI